MIKGAGTWRSFFVCARGLESAALGHRKEGKTKEVCR